MLWVVGLSITKGFGDKPHDENLRCSWCDLDDFDRIYPKVNVRTKFLSEDTIVILFLCFEYSGVEIDDLYGGR